MEEDAILMVGSPDPGGGLPSTSRSSSTKGSHESPERLFKWMKEFDYSPQMKKWRGERNIDALVDLMVLYIQKVSKSAKESLESPKLSNILKAKLLSQCTNFYGMYRRLKENRVERKEIFQTKMSELLTLYVDSEVSSSRISDYGSVQIAETILSKLYSYLDRNHTFMLSTVIRSRMLDNTYQHVWAVVFRKLLKNPPEDKKVSTYILYLLSFKIWRVVTKGSQNRKSVTAQAISNLKLPDNFLQNCISSDVIPSILPSELAKDCEDVVKFVMQEMNDAQMKGKNFLKLIENRGFLSILNAKIKSEPKVLSIPIVDLCEEETIPASSSNGIIKFCEDDNNKKSQETGITNYYNKEKNCGKVDPSSTASINLPGEITGVNEEVVNDESSSNKNNKISSVAERNLQANLLKKKIKRRKTSFSIKERRRYRNQKILKNLEIFIRKYNNKKVNHKHKKKNLQRTSQPETIQEEANEAEKGSGEVFKSVSVQINDKEEEMPLPSSSDVETFFDNLQNMYTGTGYENKKQTDLDIKWFYENDLLNEINIEENTSKYPKEADNTKAIVDSQSEEQILLLSSEEEDNSHSNDDCPDENSETPQPRIFCKRIETLTDCGATNLVSNSCQGSKDSTEKNLNTINPENITERNHLANTIDNNECSSLNENQKKFPKFTIMPGVNQEVSLIKEVTDLSLREMRLSESPSVTGKKRDCNNGVKERSDMFSSYRDTPKTILNFPTRIDKSVNGSRPSSCPQKQTNPFMLRDVTVTPIITESSSNVKSKHPNLFARNTKSSIPSSQNQVSVPSISESSHFQNIEFRGVPLSNNINLFDLYLFPHPLPNINPALPFLEETSKITYIKTDFPSNSRGFYLNAYGISMHIPDTELYIKELQHKYSSDFALSSDMVKNMFEKIKMTEKSPLKRTRIHVCTLERDFIIFSKQKLINILSNASLVHLESLIYINKKEKRCKCAPCCLNEMVILTNQDLLQKMHIIQTVDDKYNYSLSRLANKSHFTVDLEAPKIIPPKKRPTEDMGLCYPSYPAKRMMSIADFYEYESIVKAINSGTQDLFPGIRFLGNLRNQNNNPSPTALRTATPEINVPFINTPNSTEDNAICLAKTAGTINKIADSRPRTTPLPLNYPINPVSSLEVGIFNSNQIPSTQINSGPYASGIHRSDIIPLSEISPPQYRLQWNTGIPPLLNHQLPLSLESNAHNILSPISRTLIPSSERNGLLTTGITRDFLSPDPFDLWHRRSIQGFPNPPLNSVTNNLVAGTLDNQRSVSQTLSPSTSASASQGLKNPLSIKDITKIWDFLTPKWQDAAPLPKDFFK